MSSPITSIPIASPVQSSGPIWSLFRLGLILFASLTLLRHGLYWTNLLTTGNAFSGSANIRAAALAGIEGILLILFLIAAIASTQASRDRFKLLGGIGAALLSVVLVGAFMDIIQMGVTPSNLSRALWTITARLQYNVVPLLCVIGMLRRVEE